MAVKKPTDPGSGDNRDGGQNDGDQSDSDKNNNSKNGANEFVDNLPETGEGSNANKEADSKDEAVSDLTRGFGSEARGAADPTEVPEVESDDEGEDKRFEGLKPGEFRGELDEVKVRLYGVLITEDGTKITVSDSRFNSNEGGSISETAIDAAIDICEKFVKKESSGRFFLKEVSGGFELSRSELPQEFEFTEVSFEEKDGEINVFAKGTLNNSESFEFSEGRVSLDAIQGEVISANNRTIFGDIQEIVKELNEKLKEEGHEYEILVQEDYTYKIVELEDTDSVEVDVEEDDSESSEEVSPESESIWRRGVDLFNKISQSLKKKPPLGPSDAKEKKPDYPEIEQMNLEENEIEYYEGKVKFGEETISYRIDDNVPRIYKEDGDYERVTVKEGEAIAKDMTEQVLEKNNVKHLKFKYDAAEGKIKVINLVISGVTEETFREESGKVSLAGILKNGNKFVINKNKVDVYEPGRNEALPPKDEEMEELVDLVNREFEEKGSEFEAKSKAGSDKLQLSIKEKESKRKPRKSKIGEAADQVKNLSLGALKWGTSPIWGLPVMGYKAGKWAWGEDNSLHRDVTKAALLIVAWTGLRLATRMTVKESLAVAKSVPGVAWETLKSPWTLSKKMWQTTGKRSKQSFKYAWNLKKPKGGVLSKSWYGLKRAGSLVAAPVAGLLGGVEGVIEGTGRGVWGGEKGGGLRGVGGELLTGGGRAKNAFSESFQFGLLKGAFVAGEEGRSWFKQLTPDILTGKNKIKSEDLSHLWLALNSSGVMDKYKKIKEENPKISFWQAFGKASEGMKSADVAKLAFAVKDVLNAEGVLGTLIPGYFVVKSALAGDEKEAEKATYAGGLIKKLADSSENGLKAFLKGFDIGEMLEAHPVLELSSDDLQELVDGSKKTRVKRLRAARAIKVLFGFQAKSNPSYEALKQRADKIEAKLKALKASAGEEDEALKERISEFESVLESARAVLTKTDKALFKGIMAAPNR